MQHLLENRYDPYGRLYTLHLCRTQRYHRLARMSPITSTRCVETPCAVHQSESAPRLFLVLIACVCVCVCIPYTILLRLTLSNSLRRLGTTLAFDVYLMGRRLTYLWLCSGKRDGVKRIRVYFVFGSDTPKETYVGRKRTEPEGTML